MNVAGEGVRVYGGVQSLFWAGYCSPPVIASQYNQVLEGNSSCFSLWTWVSSFKDTSRPPTGRQCSVSTNREYSELSIGAGVLLLTPGD